ncbi:MAG: hypothetical protein ACJ798_15645 [Phenylobacterium sp.]
MAHEEKQFEFVCNQVAHFQGKGEQFFTRFIQIVSAVIGGSIWLSMQGSLTPSKASRFAWLSDAVIVSLAVLSCAFIIEHLRAWKGYRDAQVRLGGTDAEGRNIIKAPAPLRSSVAEGFMMLAMLLVAVGFCIFNPFTL